jgi:hypothetical protein
MNDSFENNKLSSGAPTGIYNSLTNNDVPKSTGTIVLDKTP